MNEAKSGIQSTALPAYKVPTHDTSSLSLVEDEAQAADTKSKIRNFSVGATVAQAHQYKRAPHSDHVGAVRMKSFHGRLSDNGLEYLDNTINDWLDQHTDVEVKFVTSTVGLYDGKIKEPALILNVWY